MLNTFNYDLWYLILQEMYYNSNLYMDSAVEKLYNEKKINLENYNEWMNSEYHNIACDYAKERYDLYLEKLCLENPCLDRCCFCPFIIDNLFPKDCLSGFKNEIYDLTDEINSSEFKNYKSYYQRSIIEERQRLIYLITFLRFRPSVIVTDTFEKINKQYSNVKEDVMGYMSEVGLCLPINLYNELNQKVIELDNEDILHFNKTLKSATRVEKKDGYILLYWKQIKWYNEVKDYKYITFINNFIKEKAEINKDDILFIRIGTEDLDLEIIGNFYNNPFEFYLNREIHLKNAETKRIT